MCNNYNAPWTLEISLRPSTSSKTPQFMMVMLPESTIRSLFLLCLLAYCKCLVVVRPEFCFITSPSNEWRFSNPCKVCICVFVISNCPWTSYGSKRHLVTMKSSKVYVMTTWRELKTARLVISHFSMFGHSMTKLQSIFVIPSYWTSILLLWTMLSPVHLTVASSLTVAIAVSLWWASMFVAVTSIILQTGY